MANTDIFLGSGASITFIPENDIFVGIGLKSGGGALDASEQSVIQVSSSIDTDFEFIIDLYKGCIMERYLTNDTLASTHRITSNTANTFTLNPAPSPASTDYFVIKSYGAPVPAPVDTAKRLLSDQWLGILESATFPTTEIETKQVNLSLGGSRNKTFAYRGITSYSGGNLGLVANHGAWLYYFLGKCTQVICSTDALATALSTDTHRQTLAHASDDNDKFLIRSMNATTGEEAAGDDATILGAIETGPIFRRTVGNKLCPPISPFEATDAQLDFYHALDRPAGTTTLTEPITYTFEEQNGDLLPSFALENSFSKLSATTPYRTHVDTNETDESSAFVKIARGNRVNTLTMTANENETLTLTMNNNLQDKRFFGVGAKDVQEAIPAERTYELQFTGHVTDNQLYKALLNEAEDQSQTIELTFTKSNGENIILNFTDYFISANDFPMSDDKGPIAVAATVMPRNLSLCTVKTHWVLQG